jgi:FG-GAP-like repeat
LRRTALLLAAAATGAVACAAQPPGPFRAPVVLPLGSARTPAALAAADFDGDGHVDLAVASTGANDVLLLLGDGHGGFRVGKSFPAGANPTELFAADFNHDGHPDLAIANHDTTYVTILLGDGHGGMRPGPGSPLTVHSKPHPHTIDGCDANGDGNLDLVIDDWAENRLTLLLGDGKGGFAVPGAPIEVGRKPYRNLRLADLDGDGHCDIAAPSYGSGVVTVLVGDGRGGFRAGAPIPAGPAPFTVEVADLDGDGRLDLAFSNYSGQITDPSDDAITFLLGDGRGGFRPGVRLATGAAPFQLSAGDVNGDGRADVATADHGGSDLTVAYGGPGGLSPTRTVRVLLPEKPDRVLLVDVNGDGKADAAVLSGDSHALLILLAR